MIFDEHKSGSPRSECTLSNGYGFRPPKRGNGVWLLEDVPGQKFLLYGYLGVLAVWKTLLMITRWTVRIDPGFN